MIKKYRYLNSNKVVKMDDIVAARLNEVGRIIMESGIEFRSYIHMVTYGILHEVSQEEMIAFGQLCQSIADSESSIKLEDPKEILYFMFNEI